MKGPQVNLFLGGYYSVDSSLRSGTIKGGRSERLREIIGEKLEVNPEANIVICGDFNDLPERDEQKEAAGVENLITKIGKAIVLSDGTEVEIICVTVEYPDLDVDGEWWTEETDDYGKVLFDYFFLTEGARSEFVGVDHLYPEKFEGIREIEKASDHIPVVVELEDS